MLINLFLLFSLFNSGNIKAQDDVYRKEVYAIIGVNPETGLSTASDLQSKNKKEIDKYGSQLMDDKGNIKGEYLASAVNCAGANIGQCGQDIQKFMTLMKYDSRIKVAHQLEVEYSEKINAVKKNVSKYVRDNELGMRTKGYTAAKELIEARLDLAKAEFELLKNDNAGLRSKLVKEEGKVSKEDKQLKEELDKAKKLFDKKINDVKISTFDDETNKDKIRESVIDALKSAESDLEVSLTNVTADEVFGSLPSGMDICKDYAKKTPEGKKKCEELAAKYNLAAATGGSTWSPIKVSTDENCDIFDKMGAETWNTLFGFLATYKSLEFQKCSDAYGVDDSKCIEIGSQMRSMFGDPMNLTKVYDNIGSGNTNLTDVKINPSFTSAGTQTSPSMLIGGTQTSNPFSAYTKSSSSNSAASGTGMTGSNNRVNADNGANIYNSLSTQYTAIGSGASGFYNQYSDYSNKITNNNKALLGAFGKGIDANIYQERASSVQKTIEQAKGGEVRYPGTTSYTTSIDLRQKITELNKKKSDYVQELANKIANGGLAKYKLKYGSLAEKQQAAAELALSNGYTEYVKNQIQAIDSEIRLYYMNSSALMQTSSTQFFDTTNMYASNSDQVYTKRSLSLNKLKTPVSRNTTYVLKEGWEERFKKYVDEMMGKAEESKKKMNMIKSDLHKILAQSVPIVPLKKLPNLSSTAYEIRNMESIEAVAKKNMVAIDKAMQYHRERKQSTPSDLYAQYEKDATTLKTSMQNTVASINSARPAVEKSYAVINQLYVEVPKAEALREMAKRMVERGL